MRAVALDEVHGDTTKMAILIVALLFLLQEILVLNMILTFHYYCR
jgi:hypothetical protein